MLFLLHICVYGYLCILLHSCINPYQNGWTVELFLDLFDIMGHDKLLAVEDCITKENIYEGLYSTYIALIPKVNKHNSFSDFRPISLCNFIYKVISKIIAKRIKPVLSKHISKFGFLENRQIQDGVGAAQEIFHDIKRKKK